MDDSRLGRAETKKIGLNRLTVGERVGGGEEEVKSALGFVLGVPEGRGEGRGEEGRFKSKVEWCRMGWGRQEM